MVLYFLLDVVDFPQGSKADCLTLVRASGKRIFIVSYREF